MKITLNKPIIFNGVERKELDLNLDNLSANDLIEAEDMLRSKGVVSTGAGDFSRQYILAVLSRALKIAPEALREMSAKDFTKLTNETLIFLAGTESVDESGEVSKKKS